jgi:hypothetical protein
MLQIKKLHRDTYTGEAVTTGLTHQNHRWDRTEEWIPNAVTNNRITTQAVVIGNGSTRDGIDLSLIKNHKGGLLGSRKLQSYGCNSLYKEMTPDFLVSVGKLNTDEIAATSYPDNNIVYASANTILDHPGKFYLVPQDPSWNAGAIATYLAAFDGHSKVYLIGFDTSEQDLFWIKAMEQVIGLYSETEFILVVPSLAARMPEAWKYHLNFRAITTRDFVIEVDL